MAHHDTAILGRRDLCDQCSSAVAKVKVFLTDGGSLQFCEHDYRRNADKLKRPLVESTLWDLNGSDFSEFSEVTSATRR